MLSNSAARSSSSSARGNSLRPRSLRRRRLPTRSNNCTSNWRSNSAIAVLAADCDRFNARAACETFSLRAISANTASWRKVYRIYRY